MNTTGHNSTPAVRLNENLFPNIGISSGEIPRVFSSEKIFTPITSAISALAIKKPPRIKNNLVGLLLMIVRIIGIKYIKDEYDQKKKIGDYQP
jgi:hypothetical protein